MYLLYNFINLDMQLKLLLNFPKVKAKIKSVEELLDVVNLFLSKSKADIVNFELK